MFFFFLVVTAAITLFFWRRARHHLFSHQFWILFGSLLVGLVWGQGMGMTMAGPFPWDKQEAGWLLSFGFYIPLFLFTTVYLILPKPKSEAQCVRDFLQKRLERALLDSDEGLTAEINNLATLLDGIQ